MKRVIARRALLASTAGILTFGIAMTGAHPPATYEPVPQDQLTLIAPHPDPFSADVVVESVAPSASAAAVPPETRPPLRTPQSQARTEPRTTPGPAPSGRSLRGKASWYCRAGRSVCHYKYPDRAGVADLYAAACGKLRSAMGPKWRGKTVTVLGPNKTKEAPDGYIRVKLVDWCGSSDKTIDLYWDAMKALGGTGVLRVKVAW